MIVDKNALLLRFAKTQMVWQGLKIGDWVTLADDTFADDVRDIFGNIPSPQSLGSHVLGRISCKSLDTFGLQVRLFDMGKGFGEEVCLSFFTLKYLTYAEAQKRCGIKVGDIVVMNMNVDTAFPRPFGNAFTGRHKVVNLVDHGLYLEDLSGLYSFSFLNKVEDSRESSVEDRFLPGTHVLCRAAVDRLWQENYFSHTEFLGPTRYPVYVMKDGSRYSHILPYGGFVELLGTSEKPGENV